ncbi:hypothetical protein VTL71DRAFT_11470 [Oculimacula yallundae]|uniref:Uncharacterized protein n=1 Tax=Oculimacula yallundae TaxID=86028 RepID=A0ABR4CQ64_9HELO
MITGVSLDENGADEEGGEVLSFYSNICEIIQTGNERYRSGVEKRSLTLYDKFLHALDAPHTITDPRSSYSRKMAISIYPEYLLFQTIIFSLLIIIGVLTVFNWVANLITGFLSIRKSIRSGETTVRWLLRQQVQDVRRCVLLMEDEGERREEREWFVQQVGNICLDTCEGPKMLRVRRREIRELVRQVRRPWDGGGGSEVLSEV